MKTSAILCIALMLLALHGCSPSTNDGAKAIQPTSDISIALVPHAGTYDLTKVPQGVVNFTATIKNESLKTITIAHPSICFPAESTNLCESFKEGEIGANLPHWI